MMTKLKVALTFALGACDLLFRSYDKNKAFVMTDKEMLHFIDVFDENLKFIQEYCEGKLK